MRCILIRAATSNARREAPLPVVVQEKYSVHKLIDLTGRGMDALRNDGQIIGAGGVPTAGIKRGGGGGGGDWDSIYENEQSDKVRDPDTSRLLWQYSTEVSVYRPH
jgi:hypothetical protein